MTTQEIGNVEFPDGFLKQIAILAIDAYVTAVIDCYDETQARVESIPDKIMVAELLDKVIDKFLNGHLAWDEGTGACKDFQLYGEPFDVDMLANLVLTFFIPATLMAPDSIQGPIGQSVPPFTHWDEDGQEIIQLARLFIPHYIEVLKAADITEGVDLEGVPAFAQLSLQGKPPSKG